MSDQSLAHALKPFAEEDPTRTWRLFAFTTLVAALSVAVAAAPVHPVLRLLASTVAGLVIVRFFIFYHDCLHNAVFRRSKLGRYVISFFGLSIVAPPTIWRTTHNYHHAHTSKMVGSMVGSYPILTVGMYENLGRGQKIGYRIARHWLTMLMGYPTVFVIGMGLRPFLRDPRKYWDSGLSLVLHFGGLGALWWFAGFETAFFVGILPMFVACAAGSYLFYAQHNFPGVQLFNRSEWDYTQAALLSTSMIKTGPVMQWFTGNIGFHHVHHLNPCVPFYRLPEAMAAFPELQNPITTSLAPRDILASLKLQLWDPELRQMRGF